MGQRLRGDDMMGDWIPATCRSLSLRRQGKAQAPAGTGIKKGLPPFRERALEFQLRVNLLEDELDSESGTDRGLEGIIHLEARIP